MNNPAERLASSVVELVIIIATITSFFSHFMIEKAFIANAISVVLATLITFILIGDLATGFNAMIVRNILITVALALVVSMIVGLVFALHKRCS